MSMVIDTHQHFWKYNPVRDAWIDDSMAILKRDFMPEDLWPYLRENSVDGCIAVQANQSEEESRFLLRLADNHDFIKAVVGWVDLCSENARERLEYFSSNKHFKGVRHIVQAEEKGFMLQESFLKSIACLEEYHLIYEILIRKEQLPEACELVARFPNQIFVLDHLAKPDIANQIIEPWASEIKALAKFPNVHCKLSGMVTEADWENHKYRDFEPYLDVVLEAFGVQRVMYGSDWPVCNLAAEYGDVMDIIKRYIRYLSEAEQIEIMGKNASTLYHLNERR